METNVPHETEPWMFIEGIDGVIRLDLAKHQKMLEQERINLDQYQHAVSHSVQHKRHYAGLLGGGKYDDDALRDSITRINTNTRHLSDKVKLTQDAIAHQTEIVDTLTAQLAQYEVAKSAITNRRLQ